MKVLTPAEIVKAMTDEAGPGYGLPAGDPHWGYVWHGISNAYEAIRDALREEAKTVEAFDGGVGGGASMELYNAADAIDTALNTKEAT